MQGVFAIILYVPRSHLVRENTLNGNTWIKTSEEAAHILQTPAYHKNLTVPAPNSSVLSQKNVCS